MCTLTLLHTSPPLLLPLGFYRLNLGVEIVARAPLPVLKGIGDKVFAARRDLRVVIVESPRLPLETVDEVHSIVACVERILPRHLARKELVTYTGNCLE